VLSAAPAIPPRGSQSIRELLAVRAGTCYYLDMDFAPPHGPRFLFLFTLETELNLAAKVAVGPGPRG
jgi:hypothetical protein